MLEKLYPILQVCNYFMSILILTVLIHTFSTELVLHCKTIEKLMGFGEFRLYPNALLKFSHSFFHYK